MAAKAKPHAKPTEATPGSAKTAPTTRYKKYLPIGIAVIIIIAIIAALLILSKYVTLKRPSEIESLIHEVGKHMSLPTGEIPTVATVTDKSKLQNQPIFHLAENGDKVIIYLQAKRAILYRPSIKKIIDVVPVNSIEPTPKNPKTASPKTESPSKDSSVSATPADASPIRVSLYNGTEQIGLTKDYQDALEDEFDSIEVINTDNAKRKDYEKSIVINISGKDVSMLNDLANRFGVETAELPDGELAPADTDILIILGKDAL